MLTQFDYGSHQYRLGTSEHVLSTGELVVFDPGLYDK